MVSRSRIAIAESAISSRIASRARTSQGAVDPANLTPDELAFFQERDGIPLGQWSIEDREEALRILEKYPEQQNSGKVIP